jgi:hypothetical protein
MEGVRGERIDVSGDVGVASGERIDVSGEWRVVRGSM